MFVVVSYDIVEDRRRNKVFKCLKLFGDHVQFSVFECNLEQPELEKMKKKLKKIIDEKEDSIRIYKLCSSCKKLIELIGQGMVSEDPDLIVI